MNERKAGLKAKLEAELAATADDDELSVLRDRFSAEERALEHQVDHEVHTFSATIDIACAAPRQTSKTQSHSQLHVFTTQVQFFGQVSARRRCALEFCSAKLNPDTPPLFSCPAAACANRLLKY